MSIGVFVVDDSALVRQTVAFLLQDHAELTILGSAPNPVLAEPMIRKLNPNVLLLDVEMPGMDGLTFLRKMMEVMPIPTVVFSTLATEGSKVALEALALGAVSVLAKPRLGLRQYIEASRRELVLALKTAAQSHPRAGRIARPAQARQAVSPVLHALSVNKPVVLGSSTGGTQAIEQILTALPADAPAMAIVQHMPEKFTALFSQRVNELCAMSVREARHGDRMQRGTVLIAPGGKHLSLRKAGGQYYAVVTDGPTVNRHKPSVDVLFRSAAECAGADVLAILLTGMGDDGARGMKVLHDGGGRTIAQDEASCVVFGMPKEAIKLGAVDAVLPLDAMVEAILQFDARG
ncbi:protein-glutamate methylesterase/protein-glutamine glutaminase [Azohydromonas lata]|uniref:protein-glutamate methylesterase/protein-glutamine glutaminase n=1 Tax=Azohydromonas lata TaxID=45677 RepID=UPI000A9B0DD9|nr:chemotaxis response regulator protein-glutamate methylesterase [Azohydromonas lata]